MGQVALVGGGEFRPGCDIMDDYLLKMVAPKTASVLVIPTAAADAPAKAASNGVGHFARLGAQASMLMVLDGSDANSSDLVDIIDGYTHVYFAGGSPDYLLNALKDSLLLRRLRQWNARGGILAGSSAGAMVMGTYMRSPQKGFWVDGLDVCQGFAVLPHHEESDPAEVSKSLEENLPGETYVLGIDAQTCCLKSNAGWKVVGTGQVTMYRNGLWQRFGPGEALPLP